MDFAHSLTYLFEDRTWASKLLLLALFAGLSAIPVFGLLALAVVAGYTMQVAANVRHGLPLPLPGWDDYGQKFQVGGQVLLAWLVYHLPLLLLGCGGSWMLTAVAAGFLGDLTALLWVCCLLPLLFLFLLFTWTFLAVGLAAWINTDDAGILYRPGRVWQIMRLNGALVGQWVMYTILLNIIAGFLGAIPLLGWLAVLMFPAAVHGHLLGQFAHRLSLEPVRAKKVKR